MATMDESWGTPQASAQCRYVALGLAARPAPAVRLPGGFVTTRGYGRQSAAVLVVSAGSAG
ncbi:hypothetical protein, partial [Streptomyces scabiei]|uniref:hypothetical protein n=1 Tax=Streptomyces scabiei TaxID=1930 RepID=UPI001C4EBC3C